MSDFDLEKIKKIEKILHYTFKDKRNLKMAFTHSSYANQFQIESNERLEYLGDAILNFIVAEYLYNNFSDAEGGLSKKRSKLVNTQFLSQAIEKSGLENHLLLGSSFSNQIISKAVKEDLFEAITGAIYIDSNLERARRFIFRFINIRASANQENVDYKSLLQEEIQKKKGSSLVYITFEVPSVRKTFCAEIYINDVFADSSKGVSKKKAQNDCAKKVLNNRKKLDELLRLKS